MKRKTPGPDGQKPKTKKRVAVSSKSTRIRKKTKESRKSTAFLLQLLSILLIIGGAGVLIYSALNNISVFKEPKEKLTTSAQEKSGTKPLKLYIPAMSRILYVSDGFAQGDRWVISQTGVSYLTTSAPPGYGNTVLYGHNTKDKLGGLWRVQNGDFLYVVLENGEFIKYQVFERKEVSPSQVEILSPTDDSRLTVYTCSGFLDTARFVIVGKKIAIS